MYFSSEHVCINSEIIKLNTRTKGWINCATYPRIVSRILIKKSALQPEMRKTPSGGTNSTTSVKGSLLFLLLKT